MSAPLKLVFDRKILCSYEKKALRQYLDDQDWSNTWLITTDYPHIGDWIFLDVEHRNIVHGSRDFALRMLCDKVQEYGIAKLTFEPSAVCTSVSHSVPTEILMGGHTYVLKQ